MQKQYRVKIVVDKNTNVLEVGVHLNNYEALASQDSTTNSFSEIVLGQTDTESLVEQVDKILKDRKLRILDVDGVPISPLKLTSNQKRPMLYQKRSSDGQIINWLDATVREQCSYGSDHLQCTRLAKRSFPFCTHHLHVAADKMAERKSLKRSRSSSGVSDSISYDSILANQVFEEANIDPAAPQNVRRPLFQ